MHGQLDELGDAVARVDVLHLDVGQPLDLGVLHDRLAGGEQAARVRVALALRELLAHVLHDLVRRAKAERRGVADVELENALALGLHAGGLVNDGAADVIQDVVELRGLLELSHGALPLSMNLNLDTRLGRSDVLLARKPLGRHAQKPGKRLKCLAARRHLATHVLAELALSQLFPTLGRHADKVCLLEMRLAHGLSEAFRELRLLHALLPRALAQDHLFRHRMFNLN